MDLIEITLTDSDRLHGLAVVLVFLIPAFALVWRNDRNDRRG